MTDEYLKMKLLSHSQNMLIAAKSEEWSNLVALDYSWKIMLDEAIEKHRSVVESIAKELMENNDEIQLILAKAQKNLMQDSTENKHAHKAIKQYLK